MEERRKKYSVTEQLASELAQLLGKKLVDAEGVEDETVETVVKGSGNGCGDTSGGAESPATDKEVSEEAPVQETPAPTFAEGEDIELDNLNKAQLTALASSTGIPFEQKWTEDKLRQVIGKALGGDEPPAVTPKPAAKATPVTPKPEPVKAKKKKTAGPEVGSEILVKEDSGDWLPYEVTAVRGSNIFTKKWQLTLEDENVEWKYPETD